MWFFLDIILKSMAQYLTETGKETVSFSRCDFMHMVFVNNLIYPVNLYIMLFLCRLQGRHDILKYLAIIL